MTDKYTYLKHLIKEEIGENTTNFTNFSDFQASNKDENGNWKNMAKMPLVYTCTSSKNLNSFLTYGMAGSLEHLGLNGLYYGRGVYTVMDYDDKQTGYGDLCVAILMKNGFDNILFFSDKCRRFAEKQGTIQRRTLMDEIRSTCPKDFADYCESNFNPRPDESGTSNKHWFEDMLRNFYSNKLGKKYDLRRYSGINGSGHYKHSAGMLETIACQETEIYGFAELFGHDEMIVVTRFDAGIVYATNKYRTGEGWKFTTEEDFNKMNPFFDLHTKYDQEMDNKPIGGLGLVLKKGGSYNYINTTDGSFVFPFDLNKLENGEPTNLVGGKITGLTIGNKSIVLTKETPYSETKCNCEGMYSVVKGDNGKYDIFMSKDISLMFGSFIIDDFKDQKDGPITFINGYIFKFAINPKNGELENILYKDKKTNKTKIVPFEMVGKIIKRAIKGLLEESVDEVFTNDDREKFLSDVSDFDTADAKGSNYVYVYSNTSKETVDSIMKNGRSQDFLGTSRDATIYYGIGAYCTRTKDAAQYLLRVKPHYGNTIIKFALKDGFKDMFVVNDRIVKKLGLKTPWEQLKDLVPDNIRKKLARSPEWYNNYGTGGGSAAKSVYDYLKGQKILQLNAATLYDELDMSKTKIRGFVYYGGQDGDCVFVRDTNSLIPVGYSTDGGKTWIKNKYLDNDEGFNNLNQNVFPFYQYRGEYPDTDFKTKQHNGFTLVSRDGKYNYKDIWNHETILPVDVEVASEFVGGVADIVLGDKKVSIKSIDNGKDYQFFTKDGGQFSLIDFGGGKYNIFDFKTKKMLFPIPVTNAEYLNSKNDAEFTAGKVRVRMLGDSNTPTFVLLKGGKWLKFPYEKLYKAMGGV